MTSVYHELLGMIPDTPENRSRVYIEDFALIRLLFDKALPGPQVDDATVREFYGGLWLPPLDSPSMGEEFPILGIPASPLLGPYSVMQNGTSEHLKHLAFDVRDMDQVIVTVPPSDVIEIIAGRFDPKSTDEAIGSCSECQAPSREQHGGVAYYRWGEDGSSDRTLALAPPAFDQFGRGGRIAVQDTYILRTLTTDGMASAIDSIQGQTASLLEVEEFSLLGAGMSLLEPYRVIMSDAAYGLREMTELYVQYEQDGSEEEKKAAAELALSGGAEPLRPYQGFAVGAAKDDAGPYMVLALVHADEAGARENVELLKDRIAGATSALEHKLWSQTIDIQGSEIWSEGKLLLAKLRGPIALRPFRWVGEFENLIVHE